MRVTMRRLFTALLAAAFHSLSPAHADVLVINSNASDPAPRAAWAEVVERFQQRNPDVRVQLNTYDHESYKLSVRNWLTGGAPDVVFWFAGNRMRQFVKADLLEDVSELYSEDVKAELRPGALELVTVRDRQYGVPYSFYHVGLFLRRDLLEAAGSGVPQDWPALVAACDKLAKIGVRAFAIGSKDLWPTAAWFDYLNLRLNGYDFHRSLMEGRSTYTDPRVRAVFDAWGELIERGCFVESHASMSWQESQALIYRGKAAMMLIGNYIVAHFPADLRDKMDFAPFPTVNPQIARAEEAPMNSIHIPARAKNKRDAKRFLAHLLRADVQAALNRRLLLIPVNGKAELAEDRFVAAGAALLDRAEHLTQFFDRDTHEDVALAAMKGFQEFMIRPDRLENAMESAERARRRVYGP